MDFRDLTYVLAIARHKNITRAAESLYVSQPTMSKFLIGLEKELGISLFKKAGNRYILTYAGTRYVEKASEIMQLKADLDRELEDIRKNDIGILNVALPRVRSSILLPAVLPGFSAVYPNVRVNITEDYGEENEKRVTEGQVDLAFFIKGRNDNPRLDYRVLAEEELLICLSKDSPVLDRAKMKEGKPCLSLEDIQDQRVILLNPESRTRQVCDHIFKGADIKPASTMITGNLSAAAELAAAGYGVTLIFDSYVTAELLDRACFCSLEEKVTSPFVCALRKGSYLPVYAEEFISIARKSCQKNQDDLTAIC